MLFSVPLAASDCGCVCKCVKTALTTRCVCVCDCVQCTTTGGAGRQRNVKQTDGDIQERGVCFELAVFGPLAVFLYSLLGERDASRPSGRETWEMRSGVLGRRTSSRVPWILFFRSFLKKTYRQRKRALEHSRFDKCSRLQLPSCGCRASRKLLLL